MKGVGIMADDIPTAAFDTYMRARLQEQELMLRRALLFGYAVGRYESNDL